MPKEEKLHYPVGAASGRSYGIFNDANGKVVTNEVENYTHIDYSPKPEWTKGPVRGTATWINPKLNSSITQYTLQYSTNPDAENPEWHNYTGEIEIYDNNTKIQSRMIDAKGQDGDYSAITVVTNIDKLAPVVHSVTTSEITTNSVKVTVNAADADSTNTSGRSGLKLYKLSMHGRRKNMGEGNTNK